MQKHYVLGLCVIFLASTFSSCSFGNASEERSSDQFAQSIASSSQFQRELLSDGRLTYEEYERAVLATVQCVKDNGIEIAKEIHSAPGKRIAFEFVGGTTEDERARASAVYEDCYREFEETVDLVWAEQNAPDEKTLELARDALAQCLRAGGYQGLPAHPEREDFKLARGHLAFPPCQRRISQEYDLVGFGG